jgi:O-antigen/teichoic acid export membrane protein
VVLLLGIVLLLVLFWVLSAAVGFLFWAIVITAIGALVVALVNTWWRERQKRKTPGRLEQRRTEKAADRALNDLERKLGTEKEKL